ncbi:class II fructose-bisphosphate aldolase [Streptomyces sp. NPDC050529]|uniref:class II fructose-bisphosphate aldolase n=1 Tax=Streptomyces sp. NPDC050529 TaxID=3365624 RepID=UPI0037B49D97
MYSSARSRHRRHCSSSRTARAASRSPPSPRSSAGVDGSGRALHQNVLFTNTATELARRYDVLVEGEIGCIDGAGLRKWSKTPLPDFVRFVEDTDLDFIGAHVGRFHSFD